MTLDALRSKKGFTLIEIMVVIIIIGVLAAYIAPKVIGRADDAKVSQAKAQMEGIETALKMFKLDNGFYPTTEQGLQALVIKPESGRLPKNWKKGGYLDKAKVPTDPWGMEFVYLCPGVHGDFDIYSYGSDGVEGGEDYDQDLGNWDME